MALDVGSRLAHYDVTALIGEGGMGQVYQATDTKLKRQVAIKILPPSLASDHDRLARFQREAEVLASLNHPNIAAIYGLEQSDDTRALVLELVEGPTLADRIAQGPIPIDEALPIAKQIAEALEAAHEAGVIHRDLKPANIKVKDDGTVKVLDFGLAKALDTTPEGDPSLSPTLTAAATQMGVIMGTAAYMSPEQARGKPVDRRSDIWAFGAVLFEMLTGSKPFPGDDVSQTLARVIDRNPDWAALPSALPVGVGTYLRRCLEKDTKRRIRDIGDVSLALEGAFEPTTGDPSPELRPHGARRSAVPVALAALVLGSLVTGIAVWSLSRSPPPRLARFPLGASPPVDLNGIGHLSASAVVLSPDGTRAVYIAAGGQFYVREMDRLEAVPLRGAVGINPFFSPDGNWVGFRGPGFEDENDNLYRVSVEGGPPVPVSRLITGIWGASWGPDATIVMASVPPGPLFRVPANGGERQPLTEMAEGEISHRWPEFLPGGEALLFTVVKEGQRLSTENMEIWVLDLTNNQRTRLIEGGSNPRYAHTGHIVYGVDGTLRAVPFDLDRLTLTGDPVPVLEDVLIWERSGGVHFSLGGDGSLVYLPSASRVQPERSLVWVDGEGLEERIAAEPRAYSQARLSPDGRRLVIVIDQDLWLYDLERELLTVLETDTSVQSPVWTSDSEHVVFDAEPDGLSGLFRKAVNGTGEAERLTTSEFPILPGGWSGDGRALVFTATRAETLLDIGLVSMDSEHTIEWLFESENGEILPDVSPDGRWMAYASDEFGQYEVFVTPFPNVSDERWQVSLSGGNAPQWGEDSRTLYYMTDGGAVWRATNDTEPDFSPGIPEQVAEGPYAFSFDVGPDDRLLLMKPEPLRGQTARQDIILFQNWTEELKRLVPVD